MPDSWLVTKANSRQDCWASHCLHTVLAASICSTAGPVLPMGKKRSGSVSRHAAWSLQSSTSHSILRLQVRATRRHLFRGDCESIHVRATLKVTLTAASDSVRRDGGKCKASEG